MTTNEFYYLVLVLGAFIAFAVGMSAAMAQYQAWRRGQARAVAARPARHEAKPVLARAA
jgi:hypothetical protein